MTLPDNTDPNQHGDAATPPVPASSDPAPANYPPAPGYPAADAGQVPGYGQAPGYAAPGYPQAPGYAAPAYAAPTEVPGKTLGIVGFVLAILGPLSVAGLVVSIIGLVQSKKAGAKNGFALAGIIISAVMIVGMILFALLVGFLAAASIGAVCDGYPSGASIVVNGTPLTCP